MSTPCVRVCRRSQAGGNAIDAVVAGAFAAFVAEPNNAGIGGYGHLSAFLAGPDGGRFFSVDHGPRAPAAAQRGHVRGARAAARRPRLAEQYDESNTLT